MKKIITSTDMIENLLIKEKEYSYRKKEEAQTIIKCMAKEFEDHNKNSTIITKFRDFLEDRIDSIRLLKIKFTNYLETKNLSDISKSYEMIEKHTTKKKDFNIHYYFEKDYIERHYIGGCGGISIKEIEYRVFLKLNI